MFCKILPINNVQVSDLSELFYLIILIMKICKKYMRCLFVCIVVCLPCFSIASWKDEVCVEVDFDQEEWCNRVSDNYKQPYCITNVWRTRGSDDVDNAKTCISYISTNKFSTDNSDLTTKELIQSYCSSLFWESNEWRIYFAISSNNTEDLNWEQTFDSHQSLFLYALCSSFDEKRWSKSLVREAYKRDISKLLHLQQKSKWKDLCSLKENSSLEGCDLSIYVTKIFEWIMSDLFKIKYAQVLHVDTTENFDSKKKVEEFMGMYSLMETWYDNLKKTYSRTVSIIEWNQKFYKDVLNSVKVIDNSKLVSEKSNCEWSVIWMNFVACALHQKWLSLTPSFVTLVYNELLHYRHFILYYTHVMQAKAKKTGDLGYEVNRQDFQKYSDMQIEAFKMVQNNFEEFSMTYPLHIWVLLYLEKVEKFRNNSLSKIIPLFYSLSEKLQNVQEPLS